MCDGKFECDRIMAHVVVTAHQPTKTSPPEPTLTHTANYMQLGHQCYLPASGQKMSIVPPIFVSVSLSLSVSLSPCLSPCFSVCMSFLSVCLCLSVHLSVCLTVCLCAFLSVSLCVSLCLHLLSPPLHLPPHLLFHTPSLTPPLSEMKGKNPWHRPVTILIAVLGVIAIVALVTVTVMQNQPLHQKYKVPSLHQYLGGSSLPPGRAADVT